MLDKLFGGKKKTQREAASEAAETLLDSLNAMQDAMYTDEIAKIDIERAGVFKQFYSVVMDSYKDDVEKLKVFQDVINACILLENYPSGPNSRILDEKLEIAQKILDKEN